MEPTPDELAGIVDLFGGLTREELGEALAELAFRHGDEYATDAFEDEIETALRRYQLVRLDSERIDLALGDRLLVPGPMAFPALPEHAADLPHILDIDPRSIDPTEATDSVERRFREEAADAVEGGDSDRIAILIDASYELETWGGTDLTELRTRLDDAR